MFGNTTTPAFASSSPSGTSSFDQKPACQGFVPSSSHAGFEGAFRQPQETLRNQPFCSTMSAFGTSKTPAFGVTSIPAFGSSPIPSFSSAGTSSGAFSTPAFGGSTSTRFEFVRTPDSGQSYPIFGTNLGTLARNPTFGSAPTSQLGAGNGATAQPTAPRFSSSPCHESVLQRQNAGSRFTLYKVTVEADGCKTPGKIHSISAISAYKQKSHEELRWEDYQLGDKGPNSAGQSNSLNTGRTPFQISNLNSSIPATSSITSVPKTLDYGFSGFHLSVGPSTSRAIEAPSKSFWPSSLSTGFFSTSGFGSTTCSSLAPSSSLFNSSQFNPSSTLATPVLRGTSVPESPPGITHSSGIFRSPISSPSVTLSFPLFSSFQSDSSFSTLETPTLAPTFVSSNSVGNAILSGPFQTPNPILGKAVAVSDVSAPDFKTSFPVNGSTLFLGNSAPSLMSKSEPMSTSQTVPSMLSGSQLFIPTQTLGAFTIGQPQPVNWHMTHLCHLEL